MRVKSQPSRAIASFYPDTSDFLGDTGYNVLAPEFVEDADLRYSHFSHLALDSNDDFGVYNISNDKADNFGDSTVLCHTAPTGFEFNTKDEDVQPSSVELEDSSSPEIQEDLYRFYAGQFDLEDWDAAMRFVQAAISSQGEDSSTVPSQKVIQKLGLHPSRQRRAREFLRNAGLIQINFRTQLTDQCATLGHVLRSLEELQQQHF